MTELGRGRFFWFDQTLYRNTDDTLPNEAWIAGEWKRVVPSEQDLDHMREVSPAEAERLLR